MSSHHSQAAAPPSPLGPIGGNRLYSLDALRGFDMFWILGAEDIVNALAKATGSSFWNGFAEQLTHPAWNGFHMYDLIFPLFLFMAGVSSPFSVGRELEKGNGQRKVMWRVVKRGLILVALGVFHNNGLQHWKAFSDIRFGSVLGRIGLAYMFANIIFIYCKRNAQIIWFWGCIIGYWLLLKFTSAPGFLRGDLTMEGNFTSYIDRLFLPGKLYLGIHDPEGWLATLPAISTGLLGIFTGTYIKKSTHSGGRKSARMAMAGIAFILLALLWNFDFPINKNLWTSSFVCLVGGISLLFLSIFYYVIDVKGHKKWAFFFRVIGMNSILIYLSGHFIDWEHATRGTFGWLGEISPALWAPVIMSICYVMVKWLFLYFMYRQKLFLRV
jgi:predicted acyltransferase